MTLKSEGLTEEQERSLSYQNVPERMMIATLEQLEKPEIAHRLLQGEAGSQTNRRTLEAVQYRQMIENMRASRASTAVLQKYTHLTLWIAISAGITALATIANVLIAFLRDR